VIATLRLPFSFKKLEAMANTKSAAKRARQNERRTLVNRRSLTAVKNQLKGVRDALKGTDKEAAKAATNRFISTIDKAVKAGRVHRNAASRHKSRLDLALAKQA
jgi:small subunit ribosomal protein S20